MYCAKCGVKLADTEHSCPLCGTRAHPDLWCQSETPMYPRQQPTVQVSTRAIMIILTTLFLLPAVICFQCDLLLGGTIVWSGYVISALFTAYVCIVMPMWFRKPNPVIFTPCAFAAAALYVLYIQWMTGGNWYLTFALPVIGGLALIVTAVVTLVKHVKKGLLYIYGGAAIAFGALTLLMEFLLVATFTGIPFVGWSLYPLTVFAVLGGLLIFLAICRPARDMMERKTFW